jgi:pimeloyl-ACP methyl ester carboxylesterase
VQTGGRSRVRTLPNLPELLLAGPERPFWTYFARRQMWDPSALAEDDIDEMVRSIEQPGGTRAILEMYRARQLDAEQNRPHYADPISCPVLAVGAQAYPGDQVASQLAQVATDVHGTVIPASGHHIALENPAALAQASTSSPTAKPRVQSYDPSGAGTSVRTVAVPPPITVPLHGLQEVKTMNFARATRLTRLRVIVTAATLAVAGLLISTSQVGPAQAGTAHREQPGPKPTIVLEHGAWADASSWAAVIQRLQQAGYTVDAPPDPLRGLTYDSSYLADYLKIITGPIILVGHSYGGAVITNAATGNPNVKALVYVDAFIPAKGETLLQLIAAQPGSCLAGNPANVFTTVPYPGSPAGDVDLYLKTAPDPPYPGFAQCFANGLPPAEAAVLAATQRPLAFSAASTPSGVPAWQTIPSWSVIGTADHVIPAAEQLFMSKRAKAHITEIDAGHLSLISDPGAVTRVIIEAARADG